MDPHEAPRSSSVRRARILVVDDDPAMRRVLEVLLSGHGWVVETAADGRKALATLTDRIPDLVIMDLVMPGIGGLGALRRLRAEARTRKLPVILMSVISEDSSRIKAIEEGADDYLIKPFSGPELLARVATQLDLAEQRRAAAEESESLFRAVADHAPVLISMSGVDGLVDFLNQRTAEFTGRHLQELAGHGWVDVIHPEDRVRTLEAHRVGFQSRRPYELEARVRRHDGEYRWMLIAGAPRHLSSGEFAGFVVTSLDITERKVADAERARLLAVAEQARAQAEAANRMKDEFLATLSHELRTPLNAIVGWVHLLRAGRLDEATSRRALETIDRNAKIQTQLIADILDVSRIVSGKLRVQMRRLEPAPIVEAALDTVRLAAEAKGIHVGVVLDPAAGPVLGDPDRLQQVVWNLLSNAIKFTPDGGHVEVKLHRNAGHAVLDIADDGIGIAAEFLPFVFERFRQADPSTTRPQGGLGLGLAIVRHLAEVHGGEVSARSAGPGRGAAFTVSLPVVDLARRADDAHRSRALVPAPAFTGPSLEGVSVLLVDADEAAAAATGGLLRDHGAEVTQALSPAEAVDIVRRLRPDVLLARMNAGSEACHRLIRAVREMPPERGGLTPAAVFGTGGNVEERMKSLLAGYQAHLPAPVAEAELATVVASLAGRTRVLF